MGEVIQNEPCAFRLLPPALCTNPRAVHNAAHHRMFSHALPFLGSLLKVLQSRGATLRISPYLWSLSQDGRHANLPQLTTLVNTHKETAGPQDCHVQVVCFSPLTCLTWGPISFVFSSLTSTNPGLQTEVFPLEGKAYALPTEPQTRPLGLHHPSLSLSTKTSPFHKALGWFLRPAERKLSTRLIPCGIHLFFVPPVILQPLQWALVIRRLCIRGLENLRMLSPQMDSRGPSGCGHTQKFL